MLDNLFISLPSLETDRIILRKLLYTDQEDIFSYAQNPNVAKHVLWEAHTSEFDTIQFLNLVYEAYNHNNAAPWGIQLKSENKIIGTVGFVSWDREKREAEVGYALGEQYWNRGIVSEVVPPIVRFGFEKMKLQKILARCKPENIGSYRVLEKCDFHYDGLVEEQMMIKGKLEDMRLYSFLAKDYFKIK